MRLSGLLATLLLFLPAITSGQDPKPPAPVPIKVTAPAMLKIDPGNMDSMTVESTEENIRVVPMSSLIKTFRVYDPDSPKTKATIQVFVPPGVAPGSEVWIVSISARDSKTDVAMTRIVCGTAPQPPPVPPTPPTPPGPNPPVPPGPTPPQPDDASKVVFPGVTGLHVLVVDDAENRTKLPAPQWNAMYSYQVRTLLDQSCQAMPDGTRAWRFYGINASPANDNADFLAAAKRAADKKTGLPWIMVSNGKSAYEGPFPADADSLIALINKYK